MCYLIKSPDLCIPTDGSLGIQSVFERAKRLSRDFGQVRVYEEIPGKGFLPLKIYSERTKNFQEKKKTK